MCRSVFALSPTFVIAWDMHAGDQMGTSCSDGEDLDVPWTVREMYPHLANKANLGSTH